MKNFEVIINTIISFCTYLLGGIDSLFISLLIVISIDYITGILKAIYQKNLNSSVGIKGILKKIGYILIVILATVIDRIINESSMAIRTLVIYFIISNEGISILENWGAIGLPLPQKLRQVLEKLNDKDEEKID